MKERELQNKFVEWLKQNKKETQHIYEEVDCIWGMTDVILYDGRKNNGYEIKLKNVKKVIESAYRDWETDRKSTRLNSSHSAKSRMPSSA